jgi:hypothetical protein
MTVILKPFLQRQPPKLQALLNRSARGRSCSIACNSCWQHTPQHGALRPALEMVALKFQGLVPYPPEDKLDDWGLTREQQVRTGAEPRGLGPRGADRARNAAHPHPSRRDADAPRRRVLRSRARVLGSGTKTGLRARPARTRQPGACACKLHAQARPRREQTRPGRITLHAARRRSGGGEAATYALRARRPARRACGPGHDVAPLARPAPAPAAASHRRRTWSSSGSCSSPTAAGARRTMVRAAVRARCCGWRARPRGCCACESTRATWRARCLRARERLRVCAFCDAQRADWLVQLAWLAQVGLRLWRSFA